MIEKSIIITYESSDSAILQTMGAFVKEIRLRQNKTQEDVAMAAGIKRTTLARIEKGGGGTLSTFIRVIRSLEQLHVLNQFQVTSQISPLQLAKLEQKKRQRARPKKRSRKSNMKRSDW